VRALLVAQSLHQIDKAYGTNHAILDNCHVRVAFAPNDERTAKRFSDALGTATELRAQTNLSGRRLSAWLSHTTVSQQETPRPLLTPGEVLQLPANDALVLVSGQPPIRAHKLRYYTDHNFLQRCLPPPSAQGDRLADALPARPHDWCAAPRTPDARLDKSWSDMVSPGAEEDDAPAPRREAPRRKRTRGEAPLSDLPLFADLGAPMPPRAPAPEDRAVEFTGLGI
jgi:type IV secretion system protein VirD4